MTLTLLDWLENQWWEVSYTFWDNDMYIKHWPSVLMLWSSNRAHCLESRTPAWCAGAQRPALTVSRRALPHRGPEPGPPAGATPQVQSRGNSPPSSSFHTCEIKASSHQDYVQAGRKHSAKHMYPNCVMWMSRRLRMRGTFLTCIRHRNIVLPSQFCMNIAV